MLWLIVGALGALVGVAIYLDARLRTADDKITRLLRALNELRDRVNESDTLRGRLEETFFRYAAVVKRVDTLEQESLDVQQRLHLFDKQLDAAFAALGQCWNGIYSQPGTDADGEPVMFSGAPGDDDGIVCVCGHSADYHNDMAGLCCAASEQGVICPCVEYDPAGRAEIDDADQSAAEYEAALAQSVEPDETQC